MNNYSINIATLKNKIKTLEKENVDLRVKVSQLNSSIHEVRESLKTQEKIFDNVEERILEIDKMLDK